MPLRWAFVCSSYSALFFRVFLLPTRRVDGAEETIKDLKGDGPVKEFVPKRESYQFTIIEGVEK